MAVSLKFLSRAPCKQQLLAASPKVLSAVTPKTPARSPLAACSPSFFGNYEHTPKQIVEDASILSFGALPISSAFRHTAEAPVATRQGLAVSARPFAENARQHFLAKQTLRSSEAASAGNSDGIPGLGLPTLLRQADAACANGTLGGSEDAPQQDTLITARTYAERAHEHFLAKQARRSKLGSERLWSNSFGSGMPTLLGHQRAEKAGAVASAHFPVLLGHTGVVAEVAAPAAVTPALTHVDVLQGDAQALAEAAQQSFLSRHRKIASRSAAAQVP